MQHWLFPLMFATNFLNIMSWSGLLRRCKMCIYLSVLCWSFLSFCRSYLSSILIQELFLTWDQWMIYLNIAQVSPISVHVLMSNYDFMLPRSYPFSISFQWFYACYNFIVKCLLATLWCEYRLLRTLYSYVQERIWFSLPKAQGEVINCSTVLSSY